MICGAGSGDSCRRAGTNIFNTVLERRGINQPPEEKQSVTELVRIIERLTSHSTGRGRKVWRVASSSNKHARKSQRTQKSPVSRLSCLASLLLANCRRQIFFACLPFCTQPQCQYLADAMTIVVAVAAKLSSAVLRSGVIS